MLLQGGGGGGQPAPAAAAPSGGQPGANGAQNGAADYSAQWAEYYRSIGKVKEAEAIENQMKQKVQLLCNPLKGQLYLWAPLFSSLEEVLPAADSFPGNSSSSSTQDTTETVSNGAPCLARVARCSEESI